MKKRIKIMLSSVLVSAAFFSNMNVSFCADRDSVLALIKAPIAGITLPSNYISQAEAFLLSHPDIDYESLTAKINNVRSIILSAINGKDVKSLSDVLACISEDQKKIILSTLSQVTKEAQVAVALGDESSDNQVAEGVAEISIIDKTSGEPVFTKQSSIIKATGRVPNISLLSLKVMLFTVLSVVEISLFYVNKKTKDSLR